MQNLDGKVVVVTGAASGIGRAMAERFLSEGMAVVAADVEESALKTTVENFALVEVMSRRYLPTSATQPRSRRWPPPPRAGSAPSTWCASTPE